MTAQIQRRSFLSLLGGAAAAWPVAARAQQVRRIGVLFNGVENDRIQQAMLGELREGLATLGWIEGRNLRIELRWGASDPDRLEAHARELVSLAPVVIVTDAGVATRAAQRVTQTIPIVFMGGADPLITGLVRNIARPEGNTTGFSNAEASFAGKWLELLKGAVPRLTRAAILFNPDGMSTSMAAAYLSQIKSAAPAFSVRTTDLVIRDPVDVVRAIDAFATEPDSGIVVLPTTTNVVANRDAIIRLAAQHRLPTIYSNRGPLIAGGLMSYGAKTAGQRGQAAGYVDRLLRGAKVSELPVQFPTKFELVVNLKTAKAIGLTIPEAFLLRADEVIE